MTAQTSIETYHAIIDSGLLSEKRQRVYELFFNSEKSLTGAEVSELYKQRYATSKHSETIRNRITELKEMGVICENGVVDCQFTGRSVMSFCTTNNLPEKLEKKETLNEKLNKIISDIKELGMVMQDEEQKELLREIYKSVNQLKK